MSDAATEIAKVVASFLGGAATAIFAEPLRQRLLAPKILLEFLPEETAEYPSCHADGSQNLDAHTGRQHVSKNARVRITNATPRRTAKNCRAYLHRIERRDPKSREFVTIHWENLPLSWAFSDHKPIDIPGGTRCYFGVFHLWSGSNDLHSQAHAPYFSWKSTIGEAGLYRFTVMCVGDNFKPVITAFTFDWKHRFDLVSPTDFAADTVPK